jgi:methionyl-tRNA formyltransferase
MGEAEASCTPRTLGGPSRRLVLFGDTVGLPQLLRVVERGLVAALVAASVRPAQHEALAALAQAHGLPLLLQPRAGEPDYAAFVQRLDRLAPDLALVNSYAMILRPDVFRIPRFGAVNVHGALLPDYRGANPTEWALINGERETGVTIHAIDAGIDTGPIIAQRKVPVHFEDTWLDVRRRVGEATESLLTETLPAILAGGVALRPQEAAGARTWRRRTAEDGQFDWGQPTIDIYNLIRALVEPHPGASVDGETIRIWMSLPEILWRKHQAGRGAWTEAGWALLPHRPSSSGRSDNAPLTLDVRRLGGSPIGQCRLDGVAEAGSLVASIALAPQARVAPGGERPLRALVARFARDELRRAVAFS